MDGKSSSCWKFEMGEEEDLKREVKEEAVEEENHLQQEEHPQNPEKPTPENGDETTNCFLESWGFEMGKEALKCLVKEEGVEAVEEADNQQHPQNSDKPTSDADDNRTVDDFFASKVIGKGSRRTRSKSRKPRKLWMFGNFEVPSCAMNRTKEVKENLDPQCPSFVKMMRYSNVTQGFYLELPHTFSNMYMPKDDKECILEDEDGEEYEMKFLASRKRFSRGWKAFVTYQGLLEGDEVVFHLIGTCKFKVVVVRSTSLEVDGALGLLPLDKIMSRTESGRQFNEEEDTRTTSFVEFENFNIIINGMVLDFKISKSTRRKYYELCRARKTYLHVGFLKTISSSSAAEIISDTVGIADAIRSSNITTPKSEFAVWDQTLAGFELLGVEVGFLRTRVSKLAALSVELGNRACAKLYKKAKLEYNIAVEEIKTIEAKLQEVRQKRTRHDGDLLRLNKHIQRDESRFVEEVNAPWKRKTVMGRGSDEDYQQEQSGVEPSSDTDTDEDQMTIHQFVTSKGKHTTSDQQVRKGLGRRTKRKLKESRTVSHNHQVLPYVIARAEEIRAKLDHQYPCFGKIMLRSHVTQGFWMSFPTDFCRDHMPKFDDTYILEDEDGEEYETRFLASRLGLSKGWRGFTISQKLLEGDVLLFHLVEPRKFKVYIVRSTSFGEVDGAIIRLPQLEESSNEKEFGGEIHEDGNGDLEEGEKSTAFVDFQDFNIKFNGMVLDFEEIPDMRLKYYELCHAQKSYLHDGLLKTISSSSAVDIISDTVEIASAIKSSTVSTPSSLFTLWDQTLAAFEMLGIKVGFLRARVKKLVALSKQAKDTRHAKRYKHATAEYNHIEEEAKSLEAKLLELQQEKMELQCEIETLKDHIQMDESRFLEEAKAPW
ncbi:OLC1v1003004C1 [Oldenlandia corymbosa var. corymbosa]|uniref:OLC1v1003004C1 n=1 Tax=Oldenlandia corymbosa var. corymbosa TaxID=529605 RepID=A0AAV1D916_OLDCO|nr:OLC1v1003004C1 [Oldenlandia corymbosa var. corymbosa]